MNSVGQRVSYRLQTIRENVTFLPFFLYNCVFPWQVLSDTTVSDTLVINTAVFNTSMFDTPVLDTPVLYITVFDTPALTLLY